LTDRIDLPQGTLDLLILRTLLTGAQHGWAISERVQQVSSDALSIQQGSLYPALHRLERRGWIKAKWGASENNRRAKYYALTKAGQSSSRLKPKPGTSSPRLWHRFWKERDPPMLDDLRIRLRSLFRRGSVERELDEEIRFHFDHEVENTSARA